MMQREHRVASPPLKRRISELPHALARLKPPRRLRLRRSGTFVIVGTFALGLATLNTGNNLLYLLLGALLGIIAVSGWLSEHAIRKLDVVRVLPRSVTAGRPTRIEYRVQRTAGTASYGVRLAERAARGEAAFAAGAAYVIMVPEHGTAVAHTELLVPRRGVIALERVTIGTAFPFGLFVKERDVAAPASLLVWPRSDRPVRPPRVGGPRGRRQAVLAAAGAGAERAEYRGLREYRPGDDPRDLHARTTARLRVPVVREYDRTATDEYWIVLDTVAPDAEAGEVAVEIAAALLAHAVRQQHAAGFAAGSVLLRPGDCTLDVALDVLAAVQLTPEGVVPAPIPRATSVLVTSRDGAADGWGDVYHAARGAES